MLLLCFASAFAKDRISIASFNLCVFGQSKAEKSDVMNCLVQILRNFDIIAVQEIRDKEETALPRLLAQISTPDNPYQAVISPRLGRTASKEQYAFIYRTDLFEPLGEASVLPDPQDLFEREPFMAMFKVKEGNLDLILVDIHTKPEDAAREISLLPKVMQYAAEKYQEPDILCLGDYNADGSYFNETAYQEIFPPQNYLQLIPNSADTTVGSASLTYDRMTATSAMASDMTGTWGVYDFSSLPCVMTNGINPKTISDHYPIWIEAYTNRDTD